MMRARFAHERARVEAGLADYLVEAEIVTQPSCWLEAAARLPGVREALPRDGERVAVFGCGTSLYMARAYAALREAKGQGVTAAFAASELPSGRGYDRHIAISRSGTTTEVLDAVERLTGEVTAITAVPGATFAPGTRTVALEFANERSVGLRWNTTNTHTQQHTSLGVPGPVGVG